MLLDLSCMICSESDFCTGVLQMSKYVPEWPWSYHDIPYQHPYVFTLTYMHTGLYRIALYDRSKGTATAISADKKADMFRKLLQGPLGQKLHELYSSYWSPKNVARFLQGAAVYARCRMSMISVTDVVCSWKLHRLLYICLLKHTILLAFSVCYTYIYRSRTSLKAPFTTFWPTCCTTSVKNLG